MTVPPKPPPLRRHRPFVLLCAEQTAGSVGRQITALALTLLAVTVLDAGPFAASVILALTYLPGAVLSPFAGVLVDRVRLRRLLVLATSLQALVVGSVPLAQAAGHLTWPHIHAVAAVSGSLTFTLSIALQAALPRVVGPDRLLAANSVLTGARTLGQIGGPALGGVLVGLTGTAVALTAGSLAYAVEALVMFALPGALDTPAAPRNARGTSPTAALRAGLEVVRRERRLFRMVLAGAGLNLGSGASAALYVLYASRELSLSPWQLGATYAMFSAATVLGIVVAKRFGERLGLWRTTRFCGLVAGAAGFLVPTASLGPAFPLLLAYQVSYGLAVTVWTISLTTLQQLVAPAGMQGRVAGFNQAALLATVPVGALGGGALAAALGAVPVLVAAAAVALASGATLWAPIRTRELPLPDQAQ
ncbi:MFS transporter [Streptomyces guryensis]|uniref:MFS transporter n=1 Tax=Streptomyces guryensis TaxID=2886947 RepID=A0A9Q3VH84_9ACTN|nr:MFS transporter [Streptomyces guryensis]MCD9872958.1 MFS transporter [Streptomyces guryensis]